MSFVIGQIFENEYPPELGIWCSENGAFVEELSSVGGTRRFQIVAMPSMTLEQQQALIQERLTEAIQELLDSKAQELLYDSCLSVCSYVDTGVPKFDAEGRAFRIWRSACSLRLLQHL